MHFGRGLSIGRHYCIDGIAAICQASEAVRFLLAIADVSGNGRAISTFHNKLYAGD